MGGTDGVATHLLHRLDLADECRLVFDGAMSQPVVCVNGKEAGKWAYGYNAFRIDITPFTLNGLLGYLGTSLIQQSDDRLARLTNLSFTVLVRYRSHGSI